MNHKIPSGHRAANNTPVSTRDRISDLRRADPEIRAAEIAAHLGITRQRVHQLLRSLNLPTVIPAAKSYCQRCSKKISLGRVFCTESCRRLAAWTTFVCAGCNESVAALRSDITARRRRGSRRFFCSRPCRAKASGGQGGGHHG